MKRLACLALLVSGCGIPTDFTLHTPVCPLPVPMVTDTIGLPLGCPFMMPDSTIVVLPGVRGI